MRTITLATLVLGVIGLAVPTAVAQSFMGLGDLPGGRFGSSALDVSADGRFVTGSAQTASGAEAFLWSEETGIVGLGVPAGSSTSTGVALSGDGVKVVGQHVAGNGRAFEWTADSGIVDFDPFPGGVVERSARDMSTDGGTIVGFYEVAPGGPFVAYHSNGDSLTNIVSGFAVAVSADGSVVVGSASNEAFRWTAASGITGLGFLPGGSSGFSIAEGISADGQVVVGSSTNAAADTEAFRWTESEGMVGLGDLPGGDFNSFAWDVSADGRIVVGDSTTAEGGAPFIWDETNGMRKLADVLTDNYGLGDALTGWDLNAVQAISEDGTVIVGFGRNPDGNIEAWRAVLAPEPNTVLLGAFTFLGLLLLRNR